ncbi:hypothetical protein EV380_1020 [Zhihengliuella halotolerans]|uniref:Uncharacterized protein n=1 Tax=Zhihengliuella halotolerans TaxID=370736 RepID=A0A4Q8ABB5_9MICC|nr:hypothetical protein EV380_1020 [Zhihengliuella halotolerans]
MRKASKGFEPNEYTKTLVAISYKLGIPFQDLLDLPDFVIQEYINLALREAEETDKANKKK